MLIANRGEIACRVIATARAMGLRTIAVFSEADAEARHVALADMAVPIGQAAAAESYLRIDKIVEAALETGAEAIHPGYGFLSENPDFVDAVEAAGLIFVGPSADAIRAMGLKDAAKALMEKAGVPVVPGYHGDDQSDARLAEEADRIGYPVLIKAVGGGGGKGMRAVEAPGGFASALASARAEAASAFGNAGVLIEKLIQTPRHIEVQVFGDGARAVHLFERDCSLQRRHQKVIEEAPAPGMTEEMRAAMGAAAVRAAEAVGYRGAGTVEFIVDGSNGLSPDRFWFMEMNTRLQVEHPVTEAITGVDLVEWQLRVAMGEGLLLEQEALRITGHAVEARLYAEDAGAGFLPATGRLDRLVFPEDARIDTGVVEGDRISPHYDPMIAKIVTHGADREAALKAMDRALAGTGIAGTVTNLGFLSRLVAQPDFRAGRVDTGLIGREIEALAPDPEPSSVAVAVAAVAALDAHDGPMAGFQLWGGRRHRVLLGEREIWVTVTGDGFEVDAGGTRHRVSRDGTRWWVDGILRDLAVLAAPGEIALHGGERTRFTLADPLARAASASAAGAIEAPMPGRVTAVRTRAGDEVREGEALLTLEAMKMEHALAAPRDGVVAEVLVVEGGQVEAGAVLLRLEELPE
ncbi:biotin/lipoyl-binding protein [Alphaproteobacteria bacterium GH1-50]|uniref:Biotin/lipoyl-binding protein n=1 Tax=Kangsaoukella pontilimi TaxID=2691042 RepID=A0A7C9IFS7_9RHOB|nr:biotin/lipoyl-binding protein [Kangsaoukella pontilimi]